MCVADDQEEQPRPFGGIFVYPVVQIIERGEDVKRQLNRPSPI